VIKTIFFKYKIKKRTEEMQKLIRRAMEDLAKEGQKELVTDLLEMYFNEYAKKMGLADEFVIETAAYTFKNGSTKRTILALEKIIEFAPAKSKGLS